MEENGKLLIIELKVEYTFNKFNFKFLFLFFLYNIKDIYKTMKFFILYYLTKHSFKKLIFFFL